MNFFASASRSVHPKKRLLSQTKSDDAEPATEHIIRGEPSLPQPTKDMTKHGAAGLPEGEFVPAAQRNSASEVIMHVRHEQRGGRLILGRISKEARTSGLSSSMTTVMKHSVARRTRSRRDSDGPAALMAVDQQRTAKRHFHPEGTKRSGAPGGRMRSSNSAVVRPEGVGKARARRERGPEIA